MRIACLIFVGFFAILALLNAEAAYAQGGRVSHQAVMKLTANGRPADIAQGVSGQVRDSINGQQTFLIDIADEISVDSAITVLEQNEDVIFAEPNYEIELPENTQMSISFPDDNRPPLIDGESPLLYFDQEAVYSIGIDEAQEIATGAGITVAVIDNGVAMTHPLLVDRVLPNGFDFLDKDNDPSPGEGTYAGHGTFVSGLIARTAPDCRILPIRAFDGEGIGSSFAVAEAIHYALSHGADVINMSFSMYSSAQIIAGAIMAAENNGATLVAAAGNDFSSESVYPASYPGVIAVSGIDHQDLLASFSNYGNYVDVCAPAVDIYSALAGEYEWGTWSGTSFAAPFVSAAAALVLELNDEVGSFAMEEHLRQTAETVLLWGTVEVPDPEYGFGRIDVARAVSEVTGATGEQYGDLNGNGFVNVGDIVYLIRFVHMSGPPPVPPGQADADCDGMIDNTDVQYYVQYIFGGGPKPLRCNQ